MIRSIARGFRLGLGLGFGLGLAVVSIAATGSAPAAAQAVETIKFESGTYQRPPQLLKSPERKVTIEGKLTLPAGAAKVPAVVILHTCIGLGSVEPAIAARLHGLGYATLAFDSLTPRDWNGYQSCSGQANGNDASQVADAFAALKVLARHPAVDPARIAVVGASMGGGGAMMAAAEPARAALVGADGPRFAAHVAFYPSNRMGFDGKSLTGAPMLVLYGARDDWTPPKREGALIAYWKKTNPAVSISTKTYDAGHGWLLSGPRNFQPSRRGGGTCPFLVFSGAPGQAELLTIDGAVRSVDPNNMGALREEFASCRTNGATVEPDAAVAEQSLADTAAFLKTALAR